MLSWKDLWVQQERIADLHREAEQEHLLQEAIACHDESRRTHIGVLHRLRDWFAGHPHAPSAPVSADPSTDGWPVRFEHPERVRGQVKGCNG